MLEVSFAASQITSVMSMPSKIAWEAALGTLKWLVEHSDRGILYRERCTEYITSRDSTHRLDANILHSHTDSGHGTYDDGRAHGGHAVYLAGGPVAFTSKKLETVTDSTLYSEYAQLHKCCRDVETIRNFLSEMGPVTDALLREPTVIFCDNDTATGLAHGRKRTPQSKHIAIKFHYTKQAVRQGSVDVRRVPTADNRADLLTKSVKTVIFKKLLDKLKGFDGVAKL